MDIQLLLYIFNKAMHIKIKILFIVERPLSDTKYCL